MPGLARFFYLGVKCSRPWVSQTTNLTACMRLAASEAVLSEETRSGQIPLTGSTAQYI